MVRIAIAGATGFIGSALLEQLRRSGHEVVAIVRGSASAPDQASWDPAAGKVDTAKLAGVNVVVSTIGKNLGSRWTGEARKEFRSSRVDATKVLVDALPRIEPLPQLFISNSAVGAYGAERGAEELDEQSTRGDDFLATLCRDWEEAAQGATAHGVRTVIPRFGVVVHPKGGFLQKMLPPFRLGIGGKAGPGDQWLSWIGLADLLDAVEFIINQPHLNGVMNVTSPNPVTNEELAQTLGRVLNRPAVAPIPATALRLMFGREMADLTVLASQRAYPRRLIAAGYEFRFPLLEQALRHELGIV